MSANGTTGHLKQIGKHVYISAAEPDTECQFESPQYVGFKHFLSFVLITPLVGAQLPHLQKYLDKYKQLYPNAHQILVRSDPSFFFVRAKTRESLIRPAAEYLQTAMAHNPAPRLLIHSFSNGGAAQLVQVSQMLSQAGIRPPSRPPATCIIFDSSPGRATIRRTLEAFTVSIKSRILKALAYLFLGSWLFFYSIIQTLRRKPDIISRIRTQLNNPQILPWFTADTPRLYLYSDADRLVPHDSVEEHIAQAKQAGLNVRAEMFRGSAHVAHAKTFPEKYWDAVKSTWSESQKIFNQ